MRSWRSLAFAKDGRTYASFITAISPIKFHKPVSTSFTAYYFFASKHFNPCRRLRHISSILVLLTTEEKKKKRKTPKWHLSLSLIICTERALVNGWNLHHTSSDVQVTYAQIEVVLRTSYKASNFNADLFVTYLLGSIGICLNWMKFCVLSIIFQILKGTRINQTAGIVMSFA